MTENINRIMTLEREDISDVERELFLRDLKRVTDEYFETEGNASLEVTRSEEGFLVCVLITARRIKTLKKPQ